MAIGQFTLALPADALGLGSLHTFYLGL